MLRLAVQVGGAPGEEVIEAADPRIGLVHRGAEKLFEARDYRQVLALANRHDWLSAVAGELGVALAVEDLLGLDLPPRATWLRTMLAELTRVFSHLVFLTTFPRLPMDPRDGPIGGAEREAVQRVLEAYTGGRLHLMITRIGGLRTTPPSDWLDAVAEVVEQVRSLLPTLGEVLLAPELRQHTDGLGPIDRRLAVERSLSGPLARAAGLDLDLRRDDPVLAYGELFDPEAPAAPGRVVTRQAGDATARLQVLLEQVDVALDLVQAAAGRLEPMAGEPIDVPLPSTLRVPEGETYVWTETPLGVAGVHLVSRGGRSPWRLKLRTPSFATLGALPEILPGTRLDELDLALASLPFILGDADR